MALTRSKIAPVLGAYYGGMPIEVTQTPREFSGYLDPRNRPAGLFFESSENLSYNRIEGLSEIQRKWGSSFHEA
jgi:hypothetical protein